MRSEFTLLFMIFSFFGFGQEDIFDEQYALFRSLGYEFNEGISKEFLLAEIDRDYNGLIEFKKELKKNPSSTFYHLIGQNFSLNKEIVIASDSCLLWDHEFFDMPEDYIRYMEYMQNISNNELVFTEMSLTIDKDNYEWLNFKVNGVRKEWKLEKVGYISAWFIYRFADLTNEFGTSGRFTYYSDQSQQYVIDYATDIEFKEFEEKTGIIRKWLKPYSELEHLKE